MFDSQHGVQSLYSAVTFAQYMQPHGSLAVLCGPCGSDGMDNNDRSRSRSRLQAGTGDQHHTKPLVRSPWWPLVRARPHAVAPPTMSEAITLSVNVEMLWFCDRWLCCSIPILLPWPFQFVNSTLHFELLLLSFDRLLRVCAFTLLFGYY